MKSNSNISAEELLNKSIACELRAAQMRQRGDQAAARAYLLEAQGWLEEALERERTK